MQNLKVSQIRRMPAFAIVLMLTVAGPAVAQEPSSPVPADRDLSPPPGPSLAFYFGSVHRGRETGGAGGVQLEIGRKGWVRGLVGLIKSRGTTGLGGVEAGVQVEPQPSAALSPYLAVTGHAGGEDLQDSGPAFHAGISLNRSRELALRLEGRAYFGQETALGLMVGIVLR